MASSKELSPEEIVERVELLIKQLDPVGYSNHNDITEKIKKITFNKLIIKRTSGIIEDGWNLQCIRISKKENPGFQLTKNNSMRRIGYEAFKNAILTSRDKITKIPDTSDTPAIPDTKPVVSTLAITATKPISAIPAIPATSAIPEPPVISDTRDTPVASTTPISINKSHEHSKVNNVSRMEQQRYLIQQKIILESEIDDILKKYRWKKRELDTVMNTLSKITFDK